MEQELGKRIAKYYYANILIASVMQANNLQALSNQYDSLSKDIRIDTASDPNKILPQRYDILNQRSPT